MALIECSECGNMVSDKAVACPKCGKLVAKVESSPHCDYAKSGYRKKDELEDELMKGRNTRQNLYNKFYLKYALLGVVLILGFFMVWKWIASDDAKIEKRLSECLSEYEEIICLGEGFAKVKNVGKYGCINSQGKLILPCEYTNISRYDDGFVIMKEKYGVADLRGRIILQCEFDDIRYWRKDCVDGTLFSLSYDYDYLGKGPSHLDVCCQELLYNNGRLTIEKEDSLFDWFDGKKTKHINENDWKRVGKKIYTPTGDNMIKVYLEDEDKVGYADQNGNIIIPCIYDMARDFYDGLAIVGFNDANYSWKYKCAIIDKAGNEISELKYDNIERCSDGFLVSTENGKGALDNEGRMIVQDKYLQVSNHKGVWDYLERYGRKKKIFECGLSAVQNKDEKWGYVNMLGQEVIPCLYDDAHDFSEGLAVVQLGNKYGCIDKKGNLIIPFLYDSFNDFLDSRAVVILNGKWGIISSRGEEIVPCSFSRIMRFSSSYFWAKRDEETFFITKNGKIISKK